MEKQLQILTPEHPEWCVNQAEIDEIQFSDDHLAAFNRPGKRAFVRQFSDRVMLARFEPGFEAPSHAHPHTMVYVVLEGGIRFGTEDHQNWNGAGTVRSVLGGHTYGPEAAHPLEGCLMYVISEGPIALDYTYPPRAMAYGL